MFYDVTNTYFESALTDEERGYEQMDYHERLFEALIEEVQAGNLEASLLEEDEIDLCKIPSDVWARIESKKLRYLRMRGSSKEHRTDLPLVSVALVIDKNGFPMDFEVFAGNSSEFKTMAQAIDTLQKKYNGTCCRPRFELCIQSEDARRQRLWLSNVPESQQPWGQAY